MNFTREQLHERHRLSHQQIDRWLGEDSGDKFLNEKIRQLEKVKKFLEVSNLLKRNGISFVNIKGPLLSYRIYGDPTLRFSHDADFVINLKDIERVIKILFENGYQFLEGVVWPQRKRQQELLVKAARHLSFVNPKTNFVVEIHWVLNQLLPISRKKQKKVLNDNLMEMDFGGQTHIVLNKELELLYLLIHGAEHRWERLKWLVDIKDYPFAEVDMAKFNKLVIQFRAGRILGQTNFLLEKFFNKSMPFSGNKNIPDFLIKQPLIAIKGKIVIHRSPADIVLLFRNSYLMFTGLDYKTKMIFSIFFRPGDLQIIDSSSKWIYYLYRPYSFIKRRIFHAG